MFNVVITTPPATLPVSVADMHAHLRLNDSAEDTALADCIGAAVEQWERDTRRPVLSTAYRQTVTRWPQVFGRGYGDYGTAVPSLAQWPCSIVLGRGGVTAVAGVSSIDAAGTAAAVPGFAAELTTAPARVYLPLTPIVPTGVVGTGRAVGYVDFVAGWANAAAVPASVRVAIKLLAAHYYEHREAWDGGALDETPDGWRRVCDGYRLGLSGDWGQG